MGTGGATTSCAETKASPVQTASCQKGENYCSSKKKMDSNRRFGSERKKKMKLLTVSVLYVASVSGTSRNILNFSGEVKGEYTQQLRTRVAGRGSGGVLYRTHPGQSRWAVANIGAEF